MRLAYLDAFAGVSGDMLLGALIHAGAPVDLLHETLAALKLGATLQVEKVDRNGIHATHAKILVEGAAAENNGHHADAGHHHQPHRSLKTIQEIISAAKLPTAVEMLALRTFNLLGAAEAKVHDAPLESIHFHEVGAVDAMADIVLTAVAATALGIDSWRCSPLNVGSGTVHCAHGVLPVPAPATVELLRGVPIYSSGGPGETVTPTGAALVRAFSCEFGALPDFAVNEIGYGAGSRDPAGVPNVLRILIGEVHEVSSTPETVRVMEVAVDDLNPQVIGYVTEQALARGALDVMCTPVFMKKNRPGTLLTILADAARAPELEALLLRETSTLGLRVRDERRVCLERRHVEVPTAWGIVRIKVGHRDGQEFNAAPEFEDCRRVAEAHAVPVKRVLEAALQSYRQEHA